MMLSAYDAEERKMSTVCTTIILLLSPESIRRGGEKEGSRDTRHDCGVRRIQRTANMIQRTAKMPQRTAKMIQRIVQDPTDSGVHTASNVWGRGALVTSSMSGSGILATDTHTPNARRER
jgi:hypothetical protein